MIACCAFTDGPGRSNGPGRFASCWYGSAARWVRARPASAGALEAHQIRTDQNLTPGQPELSGVC
jgi:hypothetical protein